MRIPTLSTHYDLTPTQTLKKLFDYFIIANFSQSTMYYGNISSLKYIMLKEKEDALLESVKESLYTLYRRYFESSDKVLNDITVEVTYDAVPETSLHYLKIRVEVTLDDVLFSINTDVNNEDVLEIFDGDHRFEIDEDFNTTIFKG
jgi:hypothetical protein